MHKTRKENARQESARLRNTIKLLATIHRWLYRVSGGKWGQTLSGSPILLLTTTGRKTGRSRT